MVRVISFDVGETLLRPYPAFGELAVRCCAEHGAVLPREAARDIEDRAGRHFADLRAKGLTFSLSEEESRDAWIGLYTDFLGAHGVPSEKIPELSDRIYATFTDPSNYRLFDDVLPVLSTLRSRGFSIGVISNWESWLSRLLHVSGLSDLLDFSVVSGSVGFEKPDPRIFEIALQLTGAMASEFCHVGDSLHSDVHGARRAGMSAILLDRHGRHSAPGTRVVQSLEELLHFTEFQRAQSERVLDSGC